MTNQVKIILSLVDKASKEFQKTDQNFKKSLKSIGLGLAAVTAAFVVAKEVMEFGKEGASLLRLEQSGDNLAASFGGNMDNIIRSISDASKSTVAESDIILSANRAMMLGLGADAEQLGQLMEVAAFRGRGLGIETTQAFNDIVTGIGRASPLILDNLGIVIDSAAVYKEYAKSIGVSRKELTKAQETTALMSAVLVDGQEQIANAGGLTDDAADSFGRLGATLKDTGDDIKKSVAEPLADVADAIVDTLTKTERMEVAFADLDAQVISGAISYSEYIDGLNKVDEGFIIVNEDGARLVEVYNEMGQIVLDVGKQQIGLTKTTVDAIKAGKELEAADNALIATWIKSIPVIDNLIDGIDGIEGSTIDLTQSLNITSQAINSGLARAGDNLKEVMEELGPKLDDATERIGGMRSVAPGLVSAFSDIRKEVTAAGAEFESTGDITDDWAESNEELAESFRDARNALAGNQGATRLLGEEIEELEKKIQAAKDATIEQARALIFENAAAGLTGQALIDLAVAHGIYSENTASALEITEIFRKELDDGTLSSAEFAQQTASLAESIARLESKDIVITETIIRNVITRAGRSAAFDIGIQTAARRGEEFVVEGTGLSGAAAQRIRNPSPRGGHRFAHGGFTGSGPSSAVAGTVGFNEFVVPEGGALVSKGGGATINIGSMVFPNVTNGEEAFQEMQIVAKQHGVQFQDVP